MSDLYRRLVAHGIGPSIAERVERLNPDWHDGVALRGLGNRYERQIYTSYCDISRKQFIRVFGHKKYDQLPRGYIRKCGRRRYVTLRGQIFARDGGWCPYADAYVFQTNPKRWANENPQFIIFTRETLLSAA